MDNITKEIWETYKTLKAKIKSASEEKDTNKCLEKVTELWMFMNRFRNCDLRYYFDEEIYEFISALNPNRRNYYPNKLKNKKEFRIAFLAVYLGDFGGASIPHRFMLKDFKWEDKSVKNYFLITNFFKKDFQNTDSYDFLKNTIQPEEIKFLTKDLSHKERGDIIQKWLIDNNIDFVVANTCPSTLYALSSNCVPLIGNLTQDCYTFTLGPGFGDITFLVTMDQLFKYKYKYAKPDHFSKVVMLPLHSEDQLEKAEELSLCELNLPKDAVISASSNMWKSFFGDSEYLMKGIGELIKKYPFYHHLFIGTERCLDNLENYLIKNPDLRNNIHFIGPVKNIYRILKKIDFWFNSFPTTGGTNIEIAKIGKPSIDIAINRNLGLHPVEFLCSNECTVISLDEFVRLGSRFITDENYRNELGNYLKSKVSREFNKDRLISNSIYKEFIIEYMNRLNKESKLEKLDISTALDYEKRISLYNSFGVIEWDNQKKYKWLRKCVEDYPGKTFGWIKLLENTIINVDLKEFKKIEQEIFEQNLLDYRIKVYLALAYDKFNNLEKALKIILEITDSISYDPIPMRIGSRLLLKNGDLEKATILFQRINKDASKENIEYLIDNQPKDKLPLYYGY